MADVLGGEGFGENAGGGRMSVYILKRVAAIKCLSSQIIIIITLKSKNSNSKLLHDKHVEFSNKPNINARHRLLKPRTAS